MKHIVNKVVVYSMIGIMQAGLGASVIEATPLHNDNLQRIIQLDDGDHDRDNDRQREHDRRLHEENARHEQEMRRHPGEGEREWHERQEREKERHEEALREIAALLLGIAIDSSR